MGTDGNSFYGYIGPHYKWQFGRSLDNRQGEEFADMFVGWVYNQWDTDSVLGIMGRDFMNKLIVGYLP